MVRKIRMETLSTAMGSIGRTGGLSSGIPVDMIGRIPFIVLHDNDHDDFQYYHGLYIIGAVSNKKADSLSYLFCHGGW